jgi:hypothetical protein
VKEARHTTSTSSFSQVAAIRFFEIRPLNPPLTDQPHLHPLREENVTNDFAPLKDDTGVLAIQQDAQGKFRAFNGFCHR